MDRKRDSARPPRGSSRAVAGRNNRLGIWEIECARHTFRAGFRERGRRRTRQDQISREAWRPGEIAELGRPAPNEENLFLLPDRFFEERTLSKGRSSRLTRCLADTLFRRQSRLSEIRFEKQTVLKALVTCRHQAAGNFLQARFTSSWRPCGSSLQSSSLRSSPS